MIDDEGNSKWFVQESWTSNGGDNRGCHHSLLWDCDSGRVIGTTIQDGMLRFPTNLVQKSQRRTGFGAWWQGRQQTVRVGGMSSERFDPYRTVWHLPSFIQLQSLRIAFQLLLLYVQIILETALEQTVKEREFCKAYALHIKIVIRSHHQSFKACSLSAVEPHQAGDARALINFSLKNGQYGTPHHRISRIIDEASTRGTCYGKEPSNSCQLFETFTVVAFVHGPC